MVPILFSFAFRAGRLVVVLEFRRGHYRRVVLRRQVQDLVDVAQAEGERPAQVHGNTRLYVRTGELVLPGNLVQTPENHTVHLPHHAVVSFDHGRVHAFGEFPGGLRIHVPAVSDVHVQKRRPERAAFRVVRLLVRFDDVGPAVADEGVAAHPYAAYPQPPVSGRDGVGAASRQRGGSGQRGALEERTACVLP